jgi:hypothetical protein
MAEMLRRLVLHREIDATNRWPGVQWRSVRALLYGSGEGSLLFPAAEALFGGMSADTASMFVQSSVDIARIDRESGGRW